MVLAATGRDDMGLALSSESYPTVPKVEYFAMCVLVVCFV